MITHQERLPRFVRRSAIFAVVAVLALGSPLAIDRAAAEDTLPGTVSVSKERFIAICEGTGGNPIDMGDNSVTCFYPDGSWSRCWFDTGVCQDSPAIKPRPGIDIVPPAPPVAETDSAPRPTTSRAAELEPASDKLAGKHKAKGRKAKKDKGKRSKRQR